MASAQFRFGGCPATSSSRTCETLFSPEDILHPILNIFNQLTKIEKDDSTQSSNDQFQVNVDVQQFKPNEVSVVVGDNVVIVEGKHEEKKDEHGSISRHFVRRFLLPDDCDVEKLQSKLSSDGVLTIFAPKKREGDEVKYTNIPISFTGPVGTTRQKVKEDQPTTA